MASAALHIAREDGGPAPSTDRIEALDFVRGCALFGILLMNITGFGLPDAYSNPRNAGGSTGADLWAWIITEVLFEGTQRALFSILFGAGVILFTARLEAAGRTDTADIYMRRNLWLIGFGLINAYPLLWSGDILFTYGVTALFLFPFRNLSARALLGIGFVTLMLSASWNLKETTDLIAVHDAARPAIAARAAGRALTPDHSEALDAWDSERAGYKARPEAIEDKIAAMRGGYVSAFLENAADSKYWQSWGLYRYFFDVFSLMLIGMGLFKAGVLSLRRGTGLYVAMVLVGYGIGLSVNIAEVRWIIANEFSAVAFSQSSISYDVGRLATTMGHLGLLLLFVRSGWLPWLRRSLTAVGRMALTSYLTHSLVCAIIFVGFGLFGQLSRHQLYYVVFAIWAVQLFISPLWLRRFRFGPVEWLWRALTYMKAPPMRRAAAT